MKAIIMLEPQGYPGPVAMCHYIYLARLASLIVVRVVIVTTVNIVTRPRSASGKLRSSSTSRTRSPTKLNSKIFIMSYNN